MELPTPDFVLKLTPNSWLGIPPTNDINHPVIISEIKTKLNTSPLLNVEELSVTVVLPSLLDDDGPDVTLVKA